MRILYDSKLLAHKDPFGTLIPGQKCKLNIYIPAAVQATGVTCIVLHENGQSYGEFPMELEKKQDA